MIKSTKYFWLFLLTSTYVAAKPTNEKLQKALASAIKEEAPETVKNILDAGAEPTPTLLEMAQQRTLPIAVDVKERKNPDNFEKLQKNMRILETFYNNKAEGTNKNLSNYLTWIIEGSQSNGKFRDKDIEIFNKEFQKTIEKIKPEELRSTEF